MAHHRLTPARLSQTVFLRREIFIGRVTVGIAMLFFAFAVLFGVSAFAYTVGMLPSSSGTTQVSNLQVGQYAYGAGFRSYGLVVSIAISRYESGGFYVDAIHYNAPGTYPASDDLGLWQINDYFWSNGAGASANSGNFDAEKLFKLSLYPVSTIAAYNAQAAYYIFHTVRGNDWRDWATYYPSGDYGDPDQKGNGVYRNYMATARNTAAQIPGSGVITAVAGIVVQCSTNGVFVHTSAGSAGTNGQVSAGSTGVITGNSAFLQINNSGRWYDWWEVNWGDNLRGWVAEDYLQRTENPGTPVITSVSPTFISVNQGSTFVISYTINAPSPRTVILGASLFPAGQTTGRIDDPSHDIKMPLPAGQSIQQRQFKVPSATAAGSYDLLVALWDDLNNDSVIDSGDQEVTEYRAANAVSVTNDGGCSYSLYPVELTLNSPGGATSSFNVSTSSSCHWAAIPNQDWISINGVGSGDGSATVGFNVSANTGSSARQGTITVQDQTFTITQSGSTPPGGGYENVTVSSVLLSPPTSRPGLTPTFYADINSPASQSVLLGATIVLSGTSSVYSDSSHDRAVTLAAGQTQYNRLFTIPSGAPTGTYDVIFGVWADLNGNGLVDGGDSLLGSSTAFGALTVQPALGTIFTTLTPQGAIDAGARWRCDGGNWLGAGVLNFQTSIGNHIVSFKTVPDWSTPPDQIVSVQTNQTTSITGAYTFAAQTGSLRVIINPPAAVSAGARWKVDNSDFQISGATLSGLSPGSHTLSFIFLSGYITPGNQIVTVVANQTAIAFGLYKVPGDLSSNPDFNGDGKPDYVLYNASTRQSALWYMNNSVRIGGAYGPALPASWQLIDAADFNGDSKPDYVLFNPGTRQTAIWYISGGTHTGGTYGPTIVSGYVLLAAADFNADGKPDYVLYNPSTHKTAIWYLNGVTHTGGAYGPTVASGYGLAAVTDFNGDGSPDYVLFNPGTHKSAIWYLSGTAFVSGLYGPNITIGYGLMGAADFNTDGKPDFVLSNPTTRRTALWYLNNNIYTGGAYGPTLAPGYSLAVP